MWRFLFLPIGLMIGLLALPYPSFGQVTLPPAVKKNRIGDTLSLYESQYFGLFTRTADFAYAVLGRNERGANIAIHYTDTAKPVTNLVIHPDALRDVFELTNNYEYYAKDAARFNPHLLTLVDVRLPFVRYEYNGRQAEIHNKEGQMEFGEIFYVTDSTLALWMLNIGYDWEFGKANVKVFRLADLTKIKVIKRVPSQWIGAAVGTAAALAVASTGNYYPNFENEAASTAVMAVGGFGLGFALGYGVENLIRFKKTYTLTPGPNGNTLNQLDKDALRKRAMFPGKLPPEFAQ